MISRLILPWPIYGSLMRKVIPPRPTSASSPRRKRVLTKAETFVDSVLKADPRNTRGLGTAVMIAHDHMTIADEQNRREDMVGWADKASERIERYRRNSTMSRLRRRLRHGVF